ncbi:unnamed protein product [Didymodactylos carnosus]|uniref:Uncharacterized protein n=1 Tax=Didymodactylos carnosus TaxID=1234261 RepID=A0A813RK69_9BILA|nr:unnamed protein product [Didymodactylos carnosus]CAF1041224.1 unnamed protein product [Didymodactylos carnosus]CAF3567057.1 unnamed protein product [Didymodactylos carnosus]CAF3809406.1 unnamed protein product [Didymodactylos carnosus]
MTPHTDTRARHVVISVDESNDNDDEHKQIHVVGSGVEQQSSNSCKQSFLIAMQEIFDLLKLPIFRILIVSMILIWSLDETNFLFLIDLLKTTGQNEEKSTIIIALTGATDLIGQLFFGYLGDIKHINSFVLWAVTAILSGLTIGIAPLMATTNLVGLYMVFAVHAFFLSAPNALGNVIMIQVVGMSRFAMAYGFSLLVSGSTSLLGYPLLGTLDKLLSSFEQKLMSR